MVDPKIMCRKHLLGEHVELHMIVGSINKGNKVDGYIKNNLIEPGSLQARHLQLLNEMAKRGYNHNSPLPLIYPFSNRIKLTNEQYNYKIDRKASKQELLNRCSACYLRRES
jgi:hypothetical protein